MKCLIWMLLSAGMLSAQPGAEPPVKRPSTKHCSVTLLTSQELTREPAQFGFAPPSGCSGPWAKVVLSADLSVTGTRLLNRTVALTIGRSNIYTGTSAQPSESVSPAWHVESDVTDLSTLFHTAQQGHAEVSESPADDGQDGVLAMSATLEFYKATPGAPAPITADSVTGMGPGRLASGTDEIVEPITAPPNVARLYLDVLAHGEGADEFWFFCAPDGLAESLMTCGHTAFREVEVRLDGQPAGAAPVYPLIRAGGVDPDLWRPIPAVQSVRLVPYRVDLSPFAGVLSDGQVHSVALSVFNANEGFVVSANLLLFTDHQSKTTSGGVLANSLVDPSPAIEQKPGAVSVSSSRAYAITGFLNTAHGRVETTVEGDVSFESAQTFRIASDSYAQHIEQTTRALQRTTTRTDWMTQHTDTRVEYPVTIEYAQGRNEGGALYIRSQVNQAAVQKRVESRNGMLLYRSSGSDRVESTDTDNYDAGGKFTGNSHRASWEEFKAVDSQGECVDRIVKSSGGLSIANGPGPACDVL